MEAKTQLKSKLHGHKFIEGHMPHSAPIFRDTFHVGESVRDYKVLEQQGNELVMESQAPVRTWLHVEQKEPNWVGDSKLVHFQLGVQFIGNSFQEKLYLGLLAPVYTVFSKFLLDSAVSRLLDEE
eukprot:Colp12_sorted_trinity150504_noHs@12171